MGGEATEGLSLERYARACDVLRHGHDDHDLDRYTYGYLAGAVPCSFDDICSFV